MTGNSPVNAEPWNLDFPKRLGLLINNTSHRKVIYIYEKADTSTFRYRAYNMCQALNSGEHWRGVYFFERELPFLEEYLDFAHVVVFVRTGWSIVIDKFLHSAKKRKIPVLFDMDDLVFNLKALPLVMNTLNIDLNFPGAYAYWFSYASRLWLTGSMCDGVIGTNEFLCERLSQTFGKPGFVINNFLNHEQIRVSEGLFNVGKKKSGKDPFVIGYFSGTPSHINDFRRVALEIRDLLDSYPTMVLEVVGFMEFPDYLRNYEQTGRILHSPLVDFLTLQAKIAAADVNIVPLVENEFTNCKSELKYFEAAVAGTITCATPTYTYSRSIVNNQTGFLCEDGEWYATIEKIFRNEVNLSSMLSGAREYCLKKYAPGNQVEHIEKMLEKAVGVPF